MIKRIPITNISGSAIQVEGDDVDTDRGMPARFLSCTAFDDLGPHAFADDRAQMRAQGLTHPFDDAAKIGWAIMLVGRNFSCGSSREHAPQGFKYAGAKAIIGISFAEIFAGSAASIGLPCVTVSEEHHAWIAHQLQMGAHTVNIDLKKMEITVEHHSESDPIPCFMPATHQKKLVEGNWDNLPALLATPMADVLNTMARIPFLNATALAPK